MSVAASAPGFWAITCYFDPCSTRRRLANYRAFRERLGVPLLTVELVHGDHADLTETDADILVQIHGGDVLWQKERLLNLALQALPDACSKVAWIDCDVLFARDDWARETSALLDSHMLVQPYGRMHLMPEDWTGVDLAPGEASKLQLSIAAVIASGIPPETCLTPDEARPPGPGYAFGQAWAARRDLLDRCGFYDACIVGGGDRAMICAAQDCFDVVMTLHRMNSRQRERYLAWAEPFRAAVGRSMAFLPGDLFHLWHGSVESRAYHERHAGLVPFEFDPFEDIDLAANGAWRWKAHKPALWQYVRDYFLSRDVIPGPASPA